MSLSGMKFRYLSCASYEIVMPNGKHLILDPSYNDFAALDGYGKFNVEDIKACDYILVSHTHFDHTTSIKYLADKFGAKVICGAMVADQMAEYLDMDFSLIYPMCDGQTFEFGDIRITAGHFRHNTLPKPMTRAAFVERSGKISSNDVDLKLNMWGSIECMDYYITFNNNTRMMVCAGKPDDILNSFTIAKEFCPNIVIRQMFGIWEAKDYAAMLNKYSAQLVLPNHQDACINKHGKQLYSYDELQSEVSKELAAIGSPTEFFCPVPYKWYDLDMKVSIC